MKPVSTILASIVLGTQVIAAEPAQPPLRLEFNDQGQCVGLRTASAVVPWIPAVPDLDRSTGAATERIPEVREAVHRLTPDVQGLRWTQTFKNLTADPMGVGPTFNARGGVGDPWTVPGLPLRVFMFPREDVGVSLIQPPDEAIWNNGERRLDPGQTITFTAYIRVHEADWRPGLAALVAACPEHMTPPNPRVHQVAGGGAYSNYHEAPDAGKYLQMGFRVNWNARFDFAALGMYVAPSPVSVDTTWKDIRGRETSIARMAGYATRMKQAGFHVLSYFNLTETGHRIESPAPPRVTARDEDLWRNPNDWVHYGIRDAVLESAPGRIQYTNWEKCVVVDPADPKYRAHLVDQATRLARDLPDADGITIDRMDHLGRKNGRRYDGLGFYKGRAEGASLLVSWMQVMDDIGPIMHKADKVIFGNPIGAYALAAYRHLDGIYTEYWREMEACSLLCVNKPLIVWSGPYDDAGMQKLLHHGAWPTCPMPGADHSQGPDPVKEALVADYGPMFDALRGRRWALHARPIACDGPAEAAVNLFVIPGGYLAVVTGAGDAKEVKVRLPSLPLPEGVDALKAWSIVPGDEWESVAAQRQGRDWSLALPITRGCGVARLHWAWIEPFQPWWTVRPSIDVQTTVSGAEIRAVTDSGPLTKRSPVWKQPLTPSGSMTVRAGVWKQGRQIGDDLVATFIEVNPQW